MQSIAQNRKNGNTSDWNIHQTDLLIYHYGSGWSYGDIAKALGVTRSAVAGKVGRLVKVGELKGRGVVKLTKAQEQKIVEMRMNGFTYQDISKKMKKKNGTICSAIKRLKCRGRDMMK